jgi:hypothetical protein
VENAENVTDKSTHKGKYAAECWKNKQKLWKAVGFSSMGIIGELTI